MCLGLDYWLLICLLLLCCLLVCGTIRIHLLGGIFVLVSTITCIAISVSSVFSKVSRFAFLLLIPFAFVYSTFMFLSCFFFLCFSCFIVSFFVVCLYMASGLV